MFATFLATIMVLVFIIANVIRQKKKGKMFSPSTQNKLFCCVFVMIAGATAANGLFHFIHGLFGYSDFPAPFGIFVGNSMFTNISNVIWGLINFTVCIFVFLSFRKSISKWLFTVCFLVGFIFISLMLRFVLLVDYFQTHTF